MYQTFCFNKVHFYLPEVRWIEKDVVMHILDTPLPDSPSPSRQTALDLESTKMCEILHNMYSGKIKQTVWNITQYIQRKDQWKSVLYLDSNKQWEILHKVYSGKISGRQSSGGLKETMLDGINWWRWGIARIKLIQIFRGTDTSSDIHVYTILQLHIIKMILPIITITNSH